MSKHRGHCRCESVVISVTSEPEVSVYCHCDDCRRSTGAPIIAAVGMPGVSVTWEARDTLTRYVHGTCTRTFCNRCGTPIAQEHESAPHLIFFYTAFMDEPDKFPPTYHSFEGQQISWLHLTDDLDRCDKTRVIEVQS
ncbi:MAG: GFA family protein [Pseudomonadota bacterium]